MRGLPLSFPPPYGALKKKVTLVLQEPSEQITGTLQGLNDSRICLDSGEFDINRCVRSYVEVDWWKRDVEPLTT